MDLQYVIDLVDEIVVTFDAEGIITMANLKADELLPIRRKDFVHHNVDVLLKEHYVESDKLIIKEVLEQRKTCYLNVPYSNGVMIFYTGAPSFDANGKFNGGVLTGRDITRLIRQQTMVRAEDQQEDDSDPMIGKSAQILKTKALINMIASTDAPVFICGESGTGKEVVAQSIYQKSLRRGKPFVPINCAAIPRELLESELFGYEDGAFTGARRKGKIGLLEKANGGTVFLDEIGEMPKELQSKLLRVIQEHKLMRVGGVEEIPIDVRYISATNLSMGKLRDEKYFRQDLYFRLAVIPIVIPPLRERREDIRLLSQYFLKQFNESYNKHVELSGAVIEMLKARKWEGNVRELRNMIERLVIVCSGETIGLGDYDIVSHLDEKPQESRLRIDGMMTLDNAYRSCDEILIPRALKLAGSRLKAAKLLGIDRSSLYRKMKDHSGLQNQQEAEG